MRPKRSITCVACSSICCGQVGLLKKDVFGALTVNKICVPPRSDGLLPSMLGRVVHESSAETARVQAWP